MPENDGHRATESVRQINEAVQELQMAMAEYDHEVLFIVEEHDVENPVAESAAVREKLLDWHSMCMIVFTRLRPYLRSHLEDEFWATNEYEVLRPDGAPPGVDDPKGGLQMLDDIHAPWSTDTSRERVRSKGYVERTRSRADLMSPRTYRKITELLVEAWAKLGFGPTPDKQTVRTEIDREMLEEVDEWRRENIDGAGANA